MFRQGRYFSGKDKLSSFSFSSKKFAVLCRFHKHTLSKRFHFHNKNIDIEIYRIFSDFNPFLGRRIYLQRFLFNFLFLIILQRMDSKTSLPEKKNPYNKIKDIKRNRRRSKKEWINDLFFFSAVMSVIKTGYKRRKKKKEKLLGFLFFLYRYK